MFKKVFVTLVVITLVFSLNIMAQLRPDEPGYVRPEARNYDFGGETVSFGVWALGGTPFGERDDYMLDDPSGPLQYHLDKLEEEFNVKLEFARFDHRNTEQIIAGVIAGDTEHDVYSQVHLFPNLAREGIIYPLDAILKEIDWYSRLPEPLQNMTGYEFLGEQYMFLYRAMNSGLPTSSTIYYNKDIFSKYDLPDPYTLWKDGDWTWDNFKEIAIKATMDTNGDGTIDLRGFGYHAYWFKRVLYNFIVTNNGTFLENEAGRYLFNLDSPEAIETISFWHDLLNEGAMPENFGSGFNMWPEGTLAMTAGYTHSDFRDNFNYGEVPYPIGPRADKHVGIGGNIPWGFVIPITAKNPKALVELTDAVFKITWSYREGTPEEYIENWIIEEAMNVPSREVLEVREWAVNNTNFDQNKKYYDMDILTSDTGLIDILRSAVLEGNVQGQLTGIKPIVQSVIDEVLNY